VHGHRLFAPKLPNPPDPLTPQNPAGTTETAVMCRPLRDWLFKPGGATAEPVRVGIHDDP